MKRTTAIINFSTIIMLSSVLVVGNIVANKYGGIIDKYLSNESININAEDVTKSHNLGKALAQEIVEEGSVLLKNQDNVLPLTSKKVNIFGWGACDNGFLYQGGGSSEGGYSADKVSLYDAFRQSGFQINEDLATKYNQLSYRRQGGPDQNQHSLYYRCYDPDESFFTEQLMNEAVSFSDVAIMVFSRRATEGDDLPSVSYDENGTADYSRNYLSLTNREAIMVREVTKRFDKVICLFNSSAPMEMGFVDYSKIDAALYIGYPGYYGTLGVANILSGKVNPSGHMVDTCAYDLTSAPSYVNSGPDATHSYSGLGGRYTDYCEDIYVGYKWYETADAEGLYKNVGLDIYGKHREGYEAVVQYPFGFGMSYTSFDWKLIDVRKQGDVVINENTVLGENDEITIQAWVENNGNVAGKDVVELYFNPPYTKGGIEKAHVNLINFYKTSLLKPGDGELVKMTFKVQDMASYDTYDKNNNGFMGYEVEEGSYKLSLRTDSHHIKVNPDNQKLELTYKIPAQGYKYDKDAKTGHEVKNRFTNYVNSVSGATSTMYEPQSLYQLSIDGHDTDYDYDQGIVYLSRADFEGTFPKKATPVRRMTQKMYDNVFKVHDPIVNSSDQMPVTGSTSTHYTLDDVKGKPYDDPIWQALIEQLDIQTMGNLIGHGGFGTNAISSINKPRCVDSDGGTGFTSGVVSGNGGHAVKYSAANILASTWNIELAYRWGHAIGEEGKALGIQGWYAPGCNVHRSPLGGRNFEYFSEDGLMAGYFVAYTVKGCTENGVYAYMKHFAGNDTDEGRNGQFKWMTEQSLREIWAKPGEIATKIGGANASMISVDRIGAVRATGSYALLTSLLRDEWGFRGSTITDYYQGGNVNDIDEGIRAGNDLVLQPSGGIGYFDDTSSATTVKYMQQAVHNILYTYIDTVYRTETATGFDISHQIGQRSENLNGTWWRTVLTVADIVIAVGLLAWATLSVLFTCVLKRRRF